VRFQRNTIVAKVAGGDSSLLQISADERRRASRVAALFSEEDLARHLQIMLRTHAELGYRQEQRFHLELGLLKMAHAQRLLPIEQLLSDVAPAGRIESKPTVMPSPRKSEPPATTRAGFVSPFESDSARKSKLSAETVPVTAPRVTATPAAQVVMGSAAPDLAPTFEHSPVVAAQEDVRLAVLNALAEAGHPMVKSMLESGQWEVQGNELLIQVASSAAVIDMSVGAAAKKVAVEAATRSLARPMKVKVVSGKPAVGPAPQPVSSNGGGRSRAEQDPIVRKMKEKFGAEIRTIIDYKEKR